MNAVKIFNQYNQWAYVLPEFIDRYPDYFNMSKYKWITECNIEKYLHNYDDIAIQGSKYYYLEGVRFNYSGWLERRKFYLFNIKLESLLDD